MSGLRRMALILVLPLALPSQVRADDQPVLELTLDEAVKRALENNVDIAVQKYNPDFSAESIRAAMGVYDPLAFASVIENSQTSPATSAFSGATKLIQRNFNFNFGVTQYAPTGASLRLEFDNTRSTTTSIFNTFNPFYNSALTASLTQPLLKNFRIDSPREQIKVSKKNKEISDVAFQQTLLVTIATVKEQYYDLIAALDNLQATTKSLGLAQKLLDENQIKVRVGTLAPLDVIQAQSEVAGREVDVITAENGIANAQDTLKSSIFPKNDPATWALKIVPTDRPSAEPRPIDIEAALASALEKRTDLVTARKNLEIIDIQNQFARNQTLPQLDLVASYAPTGIGGTQFIRQGLGGPVIDVVPGGYSDALSQLFGFGFSTWKIGVNLSYPIGNRTASALKAQARINREQAATALRRLELQVATEVRATGRAVETNFRTVGATGAARTLQAARLDAEEKKFAAGMSTNFLVTQAQRDLAAAEVNEIQSIANYRKSIVNFERALVAGLGSASGGGLTVSPTTANGTTFTASSSTTTSSTTSVATTGSSSTTASTTTP
jgi:outer membrane protein